MIVSSVPIPNTARPVRLGLDVGSYSSGPGWTVAATVGEQPSAGEISKCRQWPGAPTETPKTLTRLLLDADGKVVAWGYDARRKAEVSGTGGKDFGLRLIESIKMFLGRPSESSKSITSLSLDQTGESPERLLALFLKQIYRMAIDDIARSGYSEDQIQTCITVPAVFNDYQKHLVRQAAYEAGVSREPGALILALEPEAAAQYARISGVRVGSNDQTIETVDLTTRGIRFVVADCGGGTVDITAYRVDEDGLTEIGAVRGAWRGSMYLDIAFENLVLKPRFGGENSYARLLQRCPDAIRSIRDAWERAKQEITVGHSQPLYFQIPSSLTSKLSPGVKRDLKLRQDGEATQIIVTPEEIEAVFAEVIPRIIEIIDEQLTLIETEYGSAEHGENILLVGGFAASPYLRQSLTDHFVGRATILVPPDPGGAVLTGAVHFACNPDARARRVRYTYGISATADFEEGIDPEEKREETDRGVKCINRFSVHATAGEIVATGIERCATYHPSYKKQTEIHLDVYRTSATNPRYVDDLGCEYLGSLQIDLSEVMGLDFDRRKIRVCFHCGDTELKVRSYVVETGTPVQTVFDFEKLEALAI